MHDEFQVSFSVSSLLSPFPLLKSSSDLSDRRNEVDSPSWLLETWMQKWSTREIFRRDPPRENIITGLASRGRERTILNDLQIRRFRSDFIRLCYLFTRCTAQFCIFRGCTDKSKCDYTGSGEIAPLFAFRISTRACAILFLPTLLTYLIRNLEEFIQRKKNKCTASSKLRLNILWKHIFFP